MTGVIQHRKFVAASPELMKKMNESPPNGMFSHLIDRTGLEHGLKAFLFVLFTESETSLSWIGSIDYKGRRGLKPTRFRYNLRCGG